MSLKEMLLGGSGALVLLLSVIQITPVKVNPWTAIFSWLGKQFNSEILKRITGIETDIGNMKKDILSIRNDAEKKAAVECRVRILRFSDEMYIGQNHSHDHFKQILCDITTYEKYCDTHPEFENQICVAAIKQIKENYDERLRKHDFLN